MMRAPLGTALAHLLSLGLMAFGVAGAVLSQPSPPTVQKPTPDQIRFFETKVRPVLADNCLPCHCRQTQLSGLRLDTLAGLQKGGVSGPVVVPGDPDKSRLILAVRQTGTLKMPQGGRLKPDEITDLEAWVKMGAPWGDDGRAADPSGGLWSLQPVRKPALPTVRGKSWIRNPVDDFVLAGLEAAHLRPAAQADKRTLIRRVTYDLTGLPPTEEEVATFLADRSPNAYGQLVDRLLASPHYGERWGRRWLDVARYADTKGYVFNEDRNYPNAYTYRDWVIKAINEDMPYDRFIVDQLAADRVPEVQQEEDRRDLAALGFLTLGRRFLNSTPDIIDDRIDVTMRGFEGLTVACARCHDHKFDPIPTQDYYSLYAVFNSSDEATQPIGDKPEREAWSKFNAEQATLEDRIRNLVLDQTKRLRNALSTESPEVKQALQRVSDGAVPDGDNLKVVTNAFPAEEKRRLDDLNRQLEDLRRTAPPTPEFAMAMQDDAHPRDGVVFKRGDPNRPGDPAPRRFLLCLSKPADDRPHWTADSGRLELAEAIASKDNPLTARVFVNRVWQGHFGTGIVRTPSDFGHQGEKPTDPRLLDYLAASFMENAWSMKKLHRLIVTSATYMQSSVPSPQTLAADPDNRLWSRMNLQRLDLEEMRDSLMAVAGHLDDREIGGKSVDLWSEPFTGRRAVYGFIERQNLPGIFRTFDFATPDSTSARRFVTTVPQQALFFMNSRLVVEQARAITDQPAIRNASSDGQRVRRLYQLLFQRLPDKGEETVGLAYLHHGPALVDAPASTWRYGFGGFDPSTGRTTFTPLAEFSDGKYHIAKQFPDPKLGYVSLTPNGGHPGRDAAHAVIRRWVAPADMTVRIEGLLAHRQSGGDGVRGRVVSSRSGLLGEWEVHNSQSRTDIASLAVKKGDTIDFVLDPKTNDAYDSFEWAPVVRTVDGTQSWDAASSFGPPPPPPASRLSLYVQALLMTDEFMFVD